VRSGGSITGQTLMILDKYGQVMNTDNSSMISFSVQGTTQRSLDSHASSNFATTISGISSFYAVNGTFDISGLIVTGEPNSTQSIQLSSTGIDMQNPDNQDHYGL